ncbi:hypothetical protein ACSTKE_00235, partial [Vibrio parahaemolyticus]
LAQAAPCSENKGRHSNGCRPGSANPYQQFPTGIQPGDIPGAVPPQVISGTGESGPKAPDALRQGQPGDPVAPTAFGKPKVPYFGA